MNFFFFFYGNWWIIKIKKTGTIIFVIIVWLCEWLLFGEVELDKKLILCGKVYIFANKLA